MTLQVNTLRPQNFQVVIQGNEELEYHTQQISIPNIDAGGVTIPRAGMPVYETSDTIDYSPLLLNFIIDADMSNYIFLVEWLQKCVKEGNDFKDISVIINDNNNNPIRTIVYEDCFPTSIMEIVLNTTDEITQYVGTATLRYCNVRFE